MWRCRRFSSILAVVSTLSARVLVFVTSAAVLVLEILAGRLLAPYVGVTLETFTAIIGTVLAGIAAGSWLGGLAADRKEPRRLLGPLLIGGGVLAMLSPTIVAIAGPAFAGGGAVAIVLVTGLAFLLPALVLSAVSPVVVKMQLSSLDETGTVVGNLSAVGTAGALAGTFVTGFLLIATLPSRPIVLGVGLVLVGAGTWFGVKSMTSGMMAVGLIAALGSGALTGIVSGPCEIETAYSCAVVVVDPERSSGRILRLDIDRHSYVDIEDPTYLGFRYTKLMADVILTQTSGPVRALYIGGGGFSLPQWLASVRPNSTNLILELDPTLVEIAENELGLTNDEYDVVVGDARLSIQDVGGGYDVVVGDAFSGSTVPWHLTTVEFYEDVAETMSADGLYVMNLIDGQPADFAKAEVATISEVFSSVVVIAPPDYFTGPRGGNYVVVATNGILNLADIEFAISARGNDSIIVLGADLDAWVRDAVVLTDDFAPVDQLISR